MAVLDHNTCGWACRLVLYYSKVNISLLGRFMKPGMRLMDTFLFQPRHILQRQSPFWKKNDKFCCHSDPKHMCVCLQTGSIPFELQYQFIIKVHKALDWNHRWISTPTSPFYIKPVSMLEEHRLVLWLVWHKTSVSGVVDPFYCCSGAKHMVA